jgi:hypothetical protein
VMPAIDDNAVPSQPEGSRTFWMVMWNIINGRGGRLTQAAAGMAQIGIGLAVLMETKIVDDRHPKAASGYTIMCLKVASCNQGGGALMWKEDNQKFKVKLVLFKNSPNILTVQLVMGDKQFYIVGVYTPPNCTGGGDDLRRAGEA